MLSYGRSPYSSPYSMRGASSPTSTIWVLIVLCTIAALVLLYAFVLPKAKDGRLPNKFLQFLHNYFRFHKLYLEAIVRFIFVVYSLFVFFTGFFTFFWAMFEGYSEALLPALLIMVLGPIIVRIIFEFSMMIILLVQNVIEINRKLKGSPETPATRSTYAQPGTPTPAPRQTYVPPTTPAPTARPPYPNPAAPNTQQPPIPNPQNPNPQNPNPPVSQ